MSLRTRAWHARQRALDALVPDRVRADPAPLDRRQLEYLVGEGVLPVPEGGWVRTERSTTGSARLRTAPRSEVRAGVVADALTAELLSHEWRAVDLGRDGWRDVLAAQALDLVLVQLPGAGRPWVGREQPLQQDPDELEVLVEAFVADGVPVVLWDTGSADPDEGVGPGAAPRSHGDRLARRVDVVTAADPRVVSHYRALLPQARVLHLPPAVQPRLHNPLRAGSSARRDVLHRYLVGGELGGEDGPAPAGDLLVGVAEEVPGDGRPPSDHGLEVDVASTVLAFRSHRLVVQHAPTPAPLAVRESLEAAACGALPLRAGPVDDWEPLAGLLPVSADAGQAATTTRRLLADPATLTAQARRARRRVRQAHTLSHRVDTVLRAVALPPTATDGSVCAVVVSRPGVDLAGVLGMLGRQDHADLSVVVAHLGPDHVPARDAVREQAGNERVEVQRCAVDLDDQDALLAVARAVGARHMLRVDPRDLYLPDFVSDLVAAAEWADVAGVGKRTVVTEHTYLAGPGGDGPDRVRTWLSDPGHEDVLVPELVDATLLVDRSALLAVARPGPDGPTSLSARLTAAGQQLLATDRFSYVRRRRVPEPWSPLPETLLRGVVSGSVELLVPGCGEQAARG